MVEEVFEEARMFCKKDSKSSCPPPSLLGSSGLGRGSGGGGVVVEEGGVCRVYRQEDRAGVGEEEAGFEASL